MSRKTILIAFILATAAGIQAAVPTGAGPYRLSDYFSGSSPRIDARPETALTADQTWVVGAPWMGGGPAGVCAAIAAPRARCVQTHLNVQGTRCFPRLNLSWKSAWTERP